MSAEPQRVSRAAVQTAARNVVVSEFPLPAKLPCGFGLIRIEASGMCGSDAEQWLGNLECSGLVEYPVIPGHEPIGRIEQVDDAVARQYGVHIGDRVAIEPLAGCGRCPACRHGRAFRCHADLLRLGYRPTRFEPALWGGFADYLVLDPRLRVHRLPDQLSPQDATLFNPLASCLEWSLDDAGIKEGEIALIIGGGLRGLCLAIACHYAGAGRIILASRGLSPRRRSLAASFGVTDVLSSDPVTLAAEVAACTGGALADRVFDTTPNNVDVVSAAMGCTRPGGTILLIGLKSGACATFWPDKVAINALTIKGVIGTRASRSYKQAIDILQSGRYAFGDLHTHTVGLDEVGEAMRMLAEPGDQEVLHVTVMPGLSTAVFPARRAPVRM